MPAPEAGNGGAPMRRTNVPTWTRRSIRHSDLRRATVNGPIEIKLTTELLDSSKKPRARYVAFRVRGDEQSYTYEPENETVAEQLTRAIAAHPSLETWFLLAAAGRNGDARLHLTPIDDAGAQGGGPPAPPPGRSAPPPAAPPASGKPAADPDREKWTELRDVIAEAFKRIFGRELDARVLRVVMFTLGEFAGATRARKQGRHDA